jgi:probable HAF family extracellular repeat protein
MGGKRLRQGRWQASSRRENCLEIGKVSGKVRLFPALTAVRQAAGRCRCWRTERDAWRLGGLSLFFAPVVWRGRSNDDIRMDGLFPKEDRDMYTRVTMAVAMGITVRFRRLCTRAVTIRKGSLMNPTRRRGIILAVWGFAVLIRASPAGATPLYTLDEGLTLGGTGGVGVGINNLGEVVGQSRTTLGHDHAFLYSHGVMTDLGTLGGDTSCAWNINESRQVAGWSETSPGSYTHAFLYSGGAMADLGTLGGNESRGYGINDLGEVVGQSDTSGVNHAFLYRGGSMADLGTLGGSWSGAIGINNSTQVVGWSYVSGDYTHHAYLYADGLMTDLGTLGGMASTARGINASAQVVGGAHTSSGAWHGFLYSGGTMNDLGTLGGTESYALAINDSAQVVGESKTSTDVYHAFLYTEGSMIDLNNLIPADSGWTLNVADGINDAGQIVGRGTNPSGQSQAFLLTPIPEPATLALLGMSAFVVFRRRSLHMNGGVRCIL